MRYVPAGWRGAGPWASAPSGTRQFCVFGDSASPVLWGPEGDLILPIFAPSGAPRHPRQLRPLRRLSSGVPGGELLPTPEHRAPQFPRAPVDPRQPHGPQADLSRSGSPGAVLSLFGHKMVGAPRSNPRFRGRVWAGSSHRSSGSRLKEPPRFWSVAFFEISRARRPRRRL
ncbi:hypothetical protein NDU88_000364 [Pleurodeles waltl]|uniref:Uncharacterized protein n=1 Tax=Pleurodeles waltl TaxID=8319 RepID=A0AAV7U4S0_PLEWA|nr:hypothetical protein NDU88_000364 [Pleurodeles waltl]